MLFQAWVTRVKNKMTTYMLYHSLLPDSFSRQVIYQWFISGLEQRALYFQKHYMLIAYTVCDDTLVSRSNIQSQFEI